MKKFAALVLCLALVVCACAPAMAATVYKLGSRGTAVRTIQQKLNDLGYADLNVDGVYGKSTVDAVVRYQTANGLKADGKVGRRTMTKMFGTASMDNTAKEGRYGEGSTGAAVRAIQRALNALGFTVKVDGTYGPKTTEAVRAFQRANNLPADGIVGSSTLEVLSGGTAIANVKAKVYPKLKLGSNGKDVTKLQNRLKALGFYQGPVSGYFNKLTEEAVIVYQRSQGLKEDGIAGQATQTRLYAGT